MQGNLFILMLVVVAADAKLFASEPQSAASKGQIKFAIESKYDGTGPGATKPENAYKMYQSLEEALIAYLDDPDTKLPENDKEKAYFKLSLRPVPHLPLSNSIRPLPNSDSNGKYYYILPTNSPNAQRLELPSSQEQIFRQAVPTHRYYQQRPVSHQNYLPVAYQPSRLVPQQPKIILQKPVVHGVPVEEFNVPSPHIGLKESEIAEHDSLKETKPAQYQEFYDSSNPEQTNPEYSFSYGVHDRHTGDSKTAHETRDGDTVKGFYTLMDPDGKQRTVHYTADDKHGFKAIVRRTPSNAHA